MGTAAIDLKFTSVTKSRSKCYLEIIPEVSNIQNFDKIKWREDIDRIEYLIPVTYKIIIKKLNNLKDDHNPLKFYHSCVDLVPSSSFSNTNITCDVITKHISVHEIHNNCFNKDTHVSLLKSTAIGCIDKNKERDSNNKVKVTNVEEKGNAIMKDLLDIVNVSRNTCTIGTLTDIIQHSSAEIKNLTLAPVCKIDTYEEIAEKETPKNKDSLKHIVHFEPHLTIPIPNLKCFGENELLFQSPRWKFPFDFDTHTIKTIQPNVRVAYYKSVIEKEILPLKLILQDLVAKCTSFGLLNNYPFPSKKNQMKCIHDNETCLFDSKKICNRLVYSIVFDK